MLTYEQLAKELKFYFEDKKLNDDALKIFGQKRKESQEIEQIELFSITHNDDQYSFKRDHKEEIINEKSLGAEHQILSLIYTAIKKENDRIRFIRGLEIEPNEQLKNETAYQYTMLPKTRWEWWITPFTKMHLALKWISRNLIFDTSISQYTIGSIIAAVANSYNPHYKTEPQTLTDTLRSLIFPAGSKKPQIDKEGHIQLDTLLTDHYSAFMTFGNDEEVLKNMAVKEFKVQVDPDTLLTGVTASNSLAQELDAPEDALHIIYFNGNSGCYQHNAQWILPDLDAYAQVEKTAVTGVMFNYPGVLNSTGSVVHTPELIQSGIAMVEYLNKEKKVPYEKIGLEGVSLGSSVAAHVARYYLARSISLNGTFASKGFASTTDVAVDYTQKVPYIGWIFGFLARPWIKFGLWGTQWQLDTAAQFTSLPENERSYSVVRSDKITRNEKYAKDDGVLGHDASLHRSWRLKLPRFFHWLGWFGYDSTTYESTKNAHKMIVAETIEVDEDDKEDTINKVLKARPEKCGHSDVHHSYGKMGLFQRSSDEGNKKSVTLDERKVEVGDDENTYIRRFFTTPKKDREGNTSTSMELIRKVTNLF